MVVPAVVLLLALLLVVVVLVAPRLALCTVVQVIIDGLPGAAAVLGAGGALVTTAHDARNPRVAATFPRRCYDFGAEFLPRVRL